MYNKLLCKYARTKQSQWFYIYTSIYYYISVMSVGSLCTEQLLYKVNSFTLDLHFNSCGIDEKVYYKKI